MILYLKEQQVHLMWEQGVLSDKSRLYLRRHGYKISKFEWFTLIKVQKGTIKWGK